MKLFTLALGVVSVGELVSFLLLASLTSSSFSKRVELAHINGYVKNKHSMEEMLKREDERIALMKAKLNAGGKPKNEQMQSRTEAPLYSGQIVGTVNYLVEVGLGTPAQDLLMVIDTGSDLAWTQCKPCNVCYEQHDPIFDPAASSSYQQVPCASAQCAQIGPGSSGTCNSSINGTNCDYSITYLDGSFTMGDFALEKLTVGGDPVSTTYPFGCGHKNQGFFKGLDGILGLSRDALSFPAQTKEEFGEIFAYCMPNIFSSTAGYIEFGAASAGSTSTPLVFVNETTVYVVELEDILVEGTSNKSKPANTMVMVVDSGTVITRLDNGLYEQVRDAFKEASASIKPAPEGAGMGIFDTCYSVSDGTLFPSITFTFMGGLAFTLSAQDSVLPIDDNGTFCLAFLPLDGFSILGNYQQQGHLFTFDIPHSSLSISSNSC